MKHDYIMDFEHSTGVYEGFSVENIKFSKIADVIKKLTRDDTNPLFKGFKIGQFRLKKI